MDFKKYTSTFQGLKTESRWSRVTTLILACLVVGLVVVVTNRPTIVTIQPWTLTQDAQVTRTDASRSYIEAWGLALAELIGNVQPSTVDFVAERLEPLLSPKIYHATMDSIRGDTVNLKRDRISVRFEPREVLFEKSTGKVFVFGTSYTRRANGYENEHSEPRTYEFTIRISNYAPMITHIDMYADDPRTVDRVKRNKSREAKNREREQKAEKESRYRKSPEADLLDKGGTKLEP